MIFKICFGKMVRVQRKEHPKLIEGMQCIQKLDTR